MPRRGRASPTPTARFPRRPSWRSAGEADFQGAMKVGADRLGARSSAGLNLDPSLRLHPTDAWVVPRSLVPDPIPVCELIALALLQRPELGERSAGTRSARPLINLDGAKLLPFSPTILIGFRCRRLPEAAATSSGRSSAGSAGGRRRPGCLHVLDPSEHGHRQHRPHRSWRTAPLSVSAVPGDRRTRPGPRPKWPRPVLGRMPRFAQIGTTEQAVRTGTRGLSART